jgi:hypothetical protein
MIGSSWGHWEDGEIDNFTAVQPILSMDLSQFSAFYYSLADQQADLVVRLVRDRFPLSS